METSKIEFTRVKNDVNGNPRYVCHYLHFITPKDLKNPSYVMGNDYELALKKAKSIGGKKYHNKQYGGGIVFQSYNIRDTEKDILNLLKQN